MLLGRKTLEMQKGERARAALAAPTKRNTNQLRASCAGSTQICGPCLRLRAKRQDILSCQACQGSPTWWHLLPLMGNQPAACDLTQPDDTFNPRSESGMVMATPSGASGSKTGDPAWSNVRPRFPCQETQEPADSIGGWSDHGRFVSIGRFAPSARFPTA